MLFVIKKLYKKKLLPFLQYTLGKEFTVRDEFAGGCVNEIILKHCRNKQVSLPQTVIDFQVWTWKHCRTITVNPPCLQTFLYQQSAHPFQENVIKIC